MPFADANVFLGSKQLEGLHSPSPEVWKNKLAPSPIRNLSARTPTDPSLPIIRQRALQTASQRPNQDINPSNPTYRPLLYSVLTFALILNRQPPKVVQVYASNSPALAMSKNWPRRACAYTTYLIGKARETRAAL
ncbi:hypothetical protein CFIO01_09224 [Colletotrichum fioriniae PJ7]|uniref:Uncharacterized protein n=1 Tax=Colletotrichum fioriniae PJ7 TaxID=1445577 RepID=A0A010QE65_9PEZI|nr:hypothetical protein CFIO01_09224 [Colletotrichum fioriniae PJ7]